MIDIAIVGYGYWGPNLARNVAQSEKTRLAAIVDLDPEKRQIASSHHPSAEVATDYRSLLDKSGIDAVLIATPLSTHARIAKDALNAGCHVMVEKPLAASSAEADELTRLAEQKQRVLMVDHTFIYSVPVQKIHEAISSGSLGDIYYFDSKRVNLGLFQQDSNVLWDLAVHDVSIMRHVMPLRPVAVSATGIRNIPDQFENVSFLTMFYEGDRAIGHVDVSWLAPRKLRETVVCGSRQMLVWDDLNPAEPIRIYDKGINDQPAARYEGLVSYRMGDGLVPYVPLREPLQTCLGHFVDCIESGKTPTTNGAFGADVIRVIEAAERSMAQRGVPVSVEL